MKNIRIKAFLFFFLLIIVGNFVSYCQNTDGLLLAGQNFSGNKQIPSSELENLLPQKPNSTLPIPFTNIRYKLGIYQFFQKKHAAQLASKKFENLIAKEREKFELKTINLPESTPNYQKLKQKRDKAIEKYEKKITDGNFMMTNFGEPPVNFSAIDAQKNVEKITKYLKNKGFFDAKVNFIVDTNRIKQVNVTYLITENIPYKIKSITKNINDSKIITLLNKYEKETLLIVNQRFEEENLNTERIRIENILRNNGYFQFSRNQIKYRVRVLPNDPLHEVKIELTISPNNIGHDDKLYEIGNVEFVIDASGNENKENVSKIEIDTVFNNNLSYIFVGNAFSARFLHKKIFLRPGELFSQTNQIETQNALQNLDQFKFANPSFDTTNNKLNVRIYAVPLEKYQFTGESGMNVFQGIPGPFVNASLKVRNIFGGLESLNNQVRVGYEGRNVFNGISSGATKKDGQYNFEAGFNSSINIPLILLPGNYTKLDKYNPHTQIGLGINFADRQEYKRLNFRLAATYSWQKSQKNQFNFSLVDLNVINTPYISPTFDSVLTSLKLNFGNNLRESFRKSFVSSFSGSYVYNDNFLGQSQKGKYLRLFGEFGGNMLNFTKSGELSLLNNLLGNNLNYFKFIRLLADYRRFIAIGTNKNNLIAYRINTGLALSYNNSSDILPYEKYLFAGGSYSLRGWQPRRLGLNSFVKTDGNSNFYTYEQPGNLLLESSLEFRFPIVKLYGQLNGAFFIDAGNVWSIKKNGVDAKQSDFQIKNFMSQIAMDTGFGIRYDFTYFVIRLDAAAKVFEPILGPGKTYVLDDFFKKNKDPNFKLNWNIGIGYPF